MRHNILIVCFLVSVLLLISCSNRANVEKRIEKLLGQMTLEEKADMLSGTGFESKPLRRLGIPAMKMTDGPLGVRRGKATAFPAGAALAATWNTELIGQVGKAIAREAKAKGLNVLLGPCVNIHRTPFGGRNFESYGEDPYLASRMAVAYIKGMQEEKVIATVKHYAVNNQETDRFTVNVKVDERALREIYLPAFRAAVREAGVWAVMGAYNRLNGPYCCANKWLLTDVLKEEWGFKGLVMSDWGAVHDVDSTLNAGCDLEMPGGQFLTKDNVLRSVKEGRVDEKTVDDKIRRMLRAMLVMGLFDSTKVDTSALNSPENRALALRAAQESAVLLKNANGFLPLDKTKIKKLAVIGPNAAEASTGGGGSSIVDPFYTVSPLDGLKKKLGNAVEIRYARGVPEEIDLTPIDSSLFVPPNAKPGERGLLGEYFNNEELKGNPVLKRLDARISSYWGDESPDPLVSRDHFSIRWTGSLVPAESGSYTIGVGSDDGSRVFINGRLLVDNWGQHGFSFKSAPIRLIAGKAYPIKVEMFEGAGGAGVFLSWKLESVKKADPLIEAIESAKGADAVLVFVGTSRRYESEGFDRPDLILPNGQDRLIKAVIDANPNTVVVMNSGASILMNEWIDKTPSVIQAWFSGQEGGTAIADILFGEVNPSGKLSTTFLKKWEDSPAYGNFPGAKGIVEYKEGVFVGYRYFDTKNVEPLFPFGHGLSYTTFEYGDLKISPEKMKAEGTVRVQFSIKNTGKIAGAEVAQLYISDEKASVERPVKELKGFQKVFLQPGQKQMITLTLDKTALSFYDVNKKSWMAEPGKFNVLIGSSSRDIRLNGAFELE
jgi:beta-glucosidase